jgi:hypothetical protein
MQSLSDELDIRKNNLALANAIFNYFKIDYDINNVETDDNYIMNFRIGDLNKSIIVSKTSNNVEILPNNVNLDTNRPVKEINSDIERVLENEIYEKYMFGFINELI